VWSRLTEQSLEQVDGADCGTGRRSRVRSRQTEQSAEQAETEQSVEQVDGAGCGAGGRCWVWSRWTEQTVE
jgi:hypothetical protein